MRIQLASQAPADSLTRWTSRYELTRLLGDEIARRSCRVRASAAARRAGDTVWNRSVSSLPVRSRAGDRRPWATSRASWDASAHRGPSRTSLRPRLKKSGSEGLYPALRSLTARIAPAGAVFAHQRQVSTLRSSYPRLTISQGPRRNSQTIVEWATGVEPASRATASKEEMVSSAS